MNINEFILDKISVSLLKYKTYQSEDLENFLFFRKRFQNKQKLAIKIIEDIMASHGKEDIFKYVSYLADVEYGTLGLNQRYRDHVVHALLTFLLGIYFKECFFQENLELSPFQWKIASLFHDIAYPVQVSNDILMGYIKNMNAIKARFQKNEKRIKVKLDFDNLIELENKINSLELIQDNLKKSKINIDVEYVYNEMLTNNIICHGVISSLSVLSVIDGMYQKFNPNREYRRISSDDMPGVDWNQANFDNDIIPACAAIFVHNLDKKYFKNKRLDRSKSPIAFLLKLSDTLQDWERPTEINNDGISANKYKIDIKDNKLIFLSPIARTSKLVEEINDYLEANDVNIDYF